jgi:hypothetical protein
MITVGKMEDGKIVQIVRTATTVEFSKVPGWICICIDFEKPIRKQEQVKWIPGDTKFTWVHEFS